MGLSKLASADYRCCHIGRKAGNFPLIFNAQPVMLNGEKTQPKNNAYLGYVGNVSLEQRQAPLHVPPRACVRCALGNRQKGAQGILVIFSLYVTMVP